ncbi:MAG: DNA repair protein RecN [Caulobacteraceae bacterium]
MLIGLGIRDVVLIESLDLSFGVGLTVLTGETGAGKSILLDALGLAVGARADPALVRRGASGAIATAIFELAADHPVWAWLGEKALPFAAGEDLVLRRSLTADGRSRAFVNDQPVSVSVLRELGSMVMEVHGQHETVGLLDARTHRSLLDGFGGLDQERAACASAWGDWRTARAAAAALEEDRRRAAEETETLAMQLAELDRLCPREGEEGALGEERALLGASEKILADIGAARDGLAGEGLVGRLAQAYRALDRARQRIVQAGVTPDGAVARLIEAAAEATDRALIETGEATAAVDAAAAAFEFEPDRLERVEERLFAVRALARKLETAPDDLPAFRVRTAARLSARGDADQALAQAHAAAVAAGAAFRDKAAALTAARRSAGERLAAAVRGELAPLKMDKARFRVVVEDLGDDRAGGSGSDRVAFEVATLPGAPFASLAAIASGGELARFALALKASLVSRGGGDQPLMIFDEVDHGVGGAVADAVGLRLKRLAAGGAQVLAVTHSPQVAARADAQWQVRKIGAGAGVRTSVTALGPVAREEEIARMLSGATVTDAARAAARALIHA